MLGSNIIDYFSLSMNAKKVISNSKQLLRISIYHAEKV
jgi:hypothetical protein